MNELTELEVAQVMGRTVDSSYLAVPHSLDWQRHGACRAYRQVDANAADSFFPLGRPQKTVKALCHRCPVIAECLATAIADDLEGIWGGTTTKQREAMRRAS